ncbi:receptor-transporting protein 4-like isoform X3 [Lingula anatina]|uniref:Receptor-transporting protein 4-like isoform X3 n=1 Tax=Lingula anatina TaxID=7574 RepID=A0A1S3K2J0_LINAN|nr:receptor-transporting protein 4-like isoform X3 [Lingula anatina]|eukprot:XP_013416737.1 receptor-transporting protein 4-like isoform X3 [Lingula anatina]
MPPASEEVPEKGCLFKGMEIVWHGEFDRLFAQYFPHQWFLMPTFSPPSERWRVFKDSAKVRFQCQECGHGWTSMKGRVVFWFHLNVATNSGYVLFKLYGQQCNRCKSEKFEHAMWYPEEVIKVVGNVYNRVGQVYYGFYRPPLRIDRRPGKPRNQHNAELCQACKDGLCREEWTFS